MSLEVVTIHVAGVITKIISTVGMSDFILHHSMEIFDCCHQLCCYPYIHIVVAMDRVSHHVEFYSWVSLRDLARRDARRDRETVVSSRKPGLARNSRPIFKTLYCLRQIIKALLCLKYVLKEVLGGLAVTILARPCETLVSREVSSRKVGLARSLVLAKKPSRPCETQLYIMHYYAPLCIMHNCR